MTPGYGLWLGGRYVGVALRWGQRWRGYLPREAEPVIEGRTLLRVALALEAIGNRRNRTFRAAPQQEDPNVQ